MEAEKPGASRLVAFVGGFDPRGARHYHQLMHREADKQSKVKKTVYEVGGRSPWVYGKEAGLNHSTWEVSAADGQACDYVFVDWSDQVRAHWPKQTWRVILAAIQTYCLVVREFSSLRPLRQETPYTLWTLAYPLIYMVLCVLLACAAFFGTWLAVPNPWAGVLAGICNTGLVLFVGYKLDKVLHVSWLLRILNFARLSSEQSMAALDEKLLKTADALCAQIKQGHYQEVVVVGFSVGSAMTLPLVQALLQKLQEQKCSLQKVNFLTLGNCIPLFTLMPRAEVLREQLFALAQNRNLYWVDISSPGDSVSFGMCDLMVLSFADSNQRNLKNLINPRRMYSPRFHKLFTPTTYRWLRRNKMRMHFQYLMASELPGAYDYIALLTYRGEMTEFISRNMEK